MTADHEAALVTWLLSSPVAALVGDRITWDSEEQDVQSPALTIRLLSTRMPARHLSGRGGLRTGFVEIACHATSSTESAQLCDALINAMSALESGPTIIGSVTFGGVHLDDVTQSTPSARERYRKAARFIVHAYE